MITLALIMLNSCLHLNMYYSITVGTAECSGVSYSSSLPNQLENSSSLPKQLETVKGASEFPVERHRWNTNEVMSA